MPGHLSISHVTDKQHIERVRETIKASLEELKLPLPDTFLGRKTQEPFPNEDEINPAIQGIE